MKIIHAVIALLLSALLLGIVASAVTAAIAVNAPGVPVQGLGTAAVTQKDITIPSAYSVDPMAFKTSTGRVKPSVTVAPTKVRMSNKVGGGELRVKPSATVSPTKVKRYNKVGGGELRIKPSATVSPTKVKRYNKVGGGELRIKPSATVSPTKVKRYTNVDELRIKPSPTAKHLQLFGRKPTPVPTVKITTTPVPTNRVASPATTPAQSYGIYGIGGNTPFFKAAPSSRPPRTSTQGSSGLVPLYSAKRNAGRGPGFGGVQSTSAARAPTRAIASPIPKISINPTASPTPVPGWYTPRFPGDTGYRGSPATPVKATVTVKPTVTAKPVPRR